MSCLSFCAAAFSAAATLMCLLLRCTSSSFSHNNFFTTGCFSTLSCGRQAASLQISRGGCPKEELREGRAPRGALCETSPAACACGGTARYLPVHSPAALGCCASGCSNWVATELRHMSSRWPGSCPPQNPHGRDVPGMMPSR